RGADEHAVPVLECLASAYLEVVEVEPEVGGESGELRVVAAPPGRGVRLGRPGRGGRVHGVRVSHRRSRAHEVGLWGAGVSGSAATVRGHDTGSPEGRVPGV